jgi:predicted NBD/HSP70 family sugar kinase
VFSGAIVNLRGEVRRRIERPIDGLDGRAALAIVHEMVGDLRPEIDGILLGIGVGTPGLVDTASGTIRWAVNLDWEDLPLGAILRERYDIPVVVANDSQAAALAVHLFAGGDRPTNLIAVKVGRGIGAGVVIGGQLFHGDGFGAGEIGHTVIDPTGQACHCGRDGCLETVAAAPAILAQATALARRDPERPLGRRLAQGPTGGLELEDVRSAVASGDPGAAAVVDRAGRALGGVIGALIGALDIHRIALIGSVTALGDSWVRAVREEAGARCLGLLASDVRIEAVEAGDNEVILGATALLITRELGLVVQR